MMTDQHNTAEQMRAQFQTGEQMTQQAWRTATDLTVTTANLGIEAMEQGLRYTQTLRGQSERVMEESFQSYRQMYQDGLRAWQGYVQAVTEIMTRKS